MDMQYNVNNYTRSIETEKVEVGAGENINQMVYDDSETLDFWRTEPESIICINYCIESDFDKIVSGDKINIKGNKEGFLKSIPVGN